MSSTSASNIISHWEQAQTFSDEGRFHDAVLHFEHSKLLLLEESINGGKVSEIANELLGRINKELDDHYSLLRGNFFIALGVRKDCTKKHVRKAYKHFVLKYHPDKNISEIANTTELFQVGQTAHEVLLSDVAIKVYKPTVLVADWLKRRSQDGLTTKIEKKKKKTNKSEKEKNDKSIKNVEFPPTLFSGVELPSVMSPGSCSSKGSSEGDFPVRKNKHHHHHHRRHHKHKSGGSISAEEDCQLNQEIEVDTINKEIRTVEEDDCHDCQNSQHTERVHGALFLKERASESSTVPASSTSTSFSGDNEVDACSVKWGKSSLVDDEEEEADEYKPSSNDQSSLFNISPSDSFKKRSSVQVNYDFDSDEGEEDSSDGDDWDFAFDFNNLRWGSSEEEDHQDSSTGLLPSIKGADVAGCDGTVLLGQGSKASSATEINWKNVFPLHQEDEPTTTSSLPNLFTK